MALSDISIRRPVFAWMLMAGLIVFGAIAFKRMGISQLPDVDFPVVSVSVSYEGAAPEVMESDVVDALEDAMMSIQGVRSVSSSARYGSANVSVEFELNRDIDAAVQEIQTKVAQAQRQLPKEIEPPVISKSNPEDQPILWLTVSSDKHALKDLMFLVRDQLKDKFTTIDGVGEVFLGGYVEPNLRIWVSNEKLNQYELTVGDIVSTIQNEHAELPAGQIATAEAEWSVRTMGEARSVQEFENIVVNERGGRPVYHPIFLKQVAKIEEGTAEVRRSSRFMGKPAVGLGIRKQRGSNAVAVAQAVKSRIEDVRKDLPEGVEINVNFDTTKFIEDSVHELNFTIVLAALLTSLVCWLFLGSFSSTVNVLLAIPTSIVGAFIILNAFGFTLNTFTLLGLSLAIGVVVDDAIMVLENIVRHRALGKPRVQAAIDGSREITFAAMAATISIVAIFLPVAFMSGVIGKFFYQFGVTLTATVLLSLLEALTLTPMRCSQFLSTKSEGWIGRTGDRLVLKMVSLYERILPTCLAHRWTVVILAFVFFLGSLATFPVLKKEFTPATDQGTFMVRLQTPTGSSLAFTDAKFKIAETFLATRPEIQRYYASVGGFGGGEVTSGVVFVTLKDKGKRGINPETRNEYTQSDVMEIVRTELKKIPDLKVFIQDLSMRGFSSSRGYPVEFQVRGAEWEKLAEITQDLMKKIDATGLVADLDSNYLLGKPEIRIIPDRAKAAMRGVSVRAISETVSSLIGGQVTGKYPMNGHRYDIRVQLVPEERDQTAQVKNLYLRNNRGELVRLADVVTTEERKSLQQISRESRERTISVFANIAKGKSQDEALRAVESLSKSSLPDGYHVVLGGSAKTFKESFGDLWFAMILGFVVAYMVLASQFNSFVHPITVLMALPFSVSGAFLALLATGQSLNIFSFIGLILLMGIVKKNSILLVEFTNQVREHEGLATYPALMKACPIRLRPIVMTSLATVVGALPAALALGPGAETRVPMAVCVIGGVILSTLLTLLVVPCVYSLFDEWAQRWKPKAKPEAVTGAAMLLFTMLTSLTMFGMSEAYAETEISSQTLTLSLRTAIERARLNDPHLKTLQARVEEADALLSGAYASLLPTIDAVGTGYKRKDAARSNTTRLSGTSYRIYSAQLELGQPIFAWGMLAAIAQARKDQRIREIDYSIGARELTVGVIKAFNRILFTERKIAQLRATRTLNDEILKVTERRLRIGRGQRLDLLQVQAEQAILESKLAQTENELTDARSELAHLMGESSAIVIRAQGDWHAPDWTSYTQKLSQITPVVPEIEQKNALIRQVDDRKSVALGKHAPTLGFRGTYGRSAFTFSDLGDSMFDQWSVGLELRIPLFSGLSSIYERRALNAQQHQLEWNLAQFQNENGLNTSRARQNLELAVRVIEFAKKSYDLSSQSLSEAERNYRNSLIDYVQFLSIREQKLDSQTQLDQAIYDYRAQLARYTAEAGYPLDALVSELR